MPSLNPSELSGVTPYELLNRLNLNEPPFNPFEIAQRLNIEVDQTLSFENMGLSGSITNHNGNVKIWINPLDSDVRQRFTLAHELGHYINDILANGDIEIKDTPDTLYRDGTSDVCEVRANNFAGMLLMPKDAVLTKAGELINAAPNQSMPGKEFVSEMAKIFCVSKPAMLVRLKKLELVHQNFHI